MPPARFRIAKSGPESMFRRGAEESGFSLALRNPQDNVSGLGSALPSSTQSFPANPTNTSSSGSASAKDPVVKTVLEYLFLALALTLVATMTIRRFMRLRRDNLPISRFFALNPHHSAPRRPNVPPTSRESDGSPLPYSETHLTGFPSAYLASNPRRPRDPSRAQDIDGYGRRIGDPTIEYDHDGILTDKDVLPAYDSRGGPPKYVDVNPTHRSRLYDVGNPVPRPVVDADSGGSDTVLPSTGPALTPVSITIETEPVNAVQSEETPSELTARSPSSGTTDPSSPALSRLAANRQ